MLSKQTFVKGEIPKMLRGIKCSGSPHNINDLFRGGEPHSGVTWAAATQVYIKGISPFKYVEAYDKQDKIPQQVNHKTQVS